MTGSDDVGSTPAMSKELVKDLVNSTYIEIKNGKHLCSIECVDDVNMKIKNFINSLDVKNSEILKCILMVSGLIHPLEKKLKSLNPENNEVWATVPEANEKDVDKAVQSAQKAFENSWSTLHPRERAKYLRLIADQLRANAEHLGKIETIDTGKLFIGKQKLRQIILQNIMTTLLGLADKVEGTVVPIDKLDMQVTTTRIPIGVVAAIIPWNSQMLLTAVKLAPALAMGNTIVIKASELAPVTLLEFAKLIDKAGLPKGVINIITGLGEPCGKALTTHNLVERIAFTGGPETAKHIVKNSAENLSQVSLELGGKSPVVVFDDADQENALNGITAGIFGASGQSCIAGSRLYLQSNIYDEFLKKLISKAEKIKLGVVQWKKILKWGRLNSFKQLENIEKNIKATIEQGGKIRCGGKRSSVSNKGYYFPATIIECAKIITFLLQKMNYLVQYYQL
jgi:acyl-CoA reductase-like NAD-dependent aldehyde dehydrogenase